MKKIIITEKQFNKLKDTYRLWFDGVDGYGHICENEEDEVTADEVDITSFKPKKELADRIWNNGLINSEVRLHLLDIADDFIDFLDISWVKYKDIVLTGSICNFNWSDKSDIDIHIIFDFKDIDDNVELVKAYVDSKKNEWNSLHDNLKIYNFNVELYVEDINESAISQGIYSLEKNKWIKKPSKNNIKLHSVDTIKDVAAEIMTLIDDLVICFNNCDNDVYLKDINKQITEIIDLVKKMRKSQLESSGEMSIGNIVYKSLRREGYLDLLYNIKNQIYDKLNSL